MDDTGKFAGLMAGPARFDWADEAVSPYERIFEADAPSSRSVPSAKDEHWDDEDDGDAFEFGDEREWREGSELARFETGSGGGPGLSRVARHEIARGLDRRKRNEPWLQGIYGLVVHATGTGGLWQRGLKRDGNPLRALMQHYNNENGPSFINGWGGVEGGELVQMADERVQIARGVGMGDQVRSGKDRGWERHLPAVVVRKWRARWPGYDTPLDLLPRVPGRRNWAHPNICYLHVECVPCRSGKQVASEPMRQGLSFTRAQHDAIAALAVDIAERHGWPRKEAWWRSPRLLGHEDLTPFTRSRVTRADGTVKKLGFTYDPGALKEDPWFDWDHVYGRIETLWRERTGSSSVSGVWQTVSNVASGIGSAVAGVLKQGEAVLLVKRAIAGGERDENRLTNLVFFAAHPERIGRKIGQSEKALAREWIDLRNRVVRPILRGKEGEFPDETRGLGAYEADPYEEADQVMDEAFAAAFEQPQPEVTTELEGAAPEDLDSDLGEGDREFEVEDNESRQDGEIEEENDRDLEEPEEEEVFEAFGPPVLPVPGDGFELEIVGNKDTRSFVGSTRDVPFRWICSLELYIEEPDYLARGVHRWRLARKATGVLIGPSSVLTVAHNLWFKDRNAGKWRAFDRIRAIPGRKEEEAPFGIIETEKKFATPQQWSSSNRPDPWDFAIIRLEEAIGNKTFKELDGRRLGWWGSVDWGEGTSTKPLKLDWLRKERWTVRSAGYPLERCGRRTLKNAEEIARCARDEPQLWASTQWYARGTVEYVDSPPGFLLHTIDTTEGHSGSPVWYYYRDSESGRVRRWLVGLHAGASEFTLADGSRRRLNYAIWIRKEVLDTVAALEAQL